MNLQNSPVFIIVFSIIFILAIITLTIIFAIKSRKKIFEKELEKKDLEIAFEKQTTLTVIEAQEQERKRIAQDLHDDVSSKLIALAMNLHLLKANNVTPDESAQIIAIIENISNSALDTSRKIAHNLCLPILEKFGLDEAIEEIISDFNASKNIVIKYYSSAKLQLLSKEIQLHVFRIVQELFNNSVKHGKTDLVNLSFTATENNIQLLYTDNGVGLKRPTFEKNKGLGFLNILSRLNAIKGQYEIDFEYQSGFKITILF